MDLSLGCNLGQSSGNHLPPGAIFRCGSDGVDIIGLSIKIAAAMNGAADDPPNTYYVRKIDGTEYYKKGAWPTVAVNDGTVIDTKIDACSSGDIFEFAAGEYMIRSNIGGKSNLKFRATTNPLYSGETVLYSTSSYLFYCPTAANGLELSGFILDGKANSSRVLWANTNTTTGVLLRNCTFKNFTSSAIYGESGGAFGITLYNIDFQKNNTRNLISGTSGWNVLTVDGQIISDTVYPGIIVTTTSVVNMFRTTFFGGIPLSSSGTNSINFCYFDSLEDGTDYRKLDWLLLYGSNTSVLNNCYFSCVKGYFLRAYESASVIVNNPVFIGTSMLESESIHPVVLKEGTSTVTVNNPYVYTSPFYMPENICVGATVSGKVSTLSGASMDIDAASYPGRDGYIMVCLDDGEDHSAHQRDVVDVWRAKGVKGTMFINPGYLGEIGMIPHADLVALAGEEYHDSVEFGLHTWSHASLTSTVAFKLATKGAYTATLSISEEGLTIVCSDPAGNVDIDFSSGDYHCMWHVINYINVTKSTYYAVTEEFSGGSARPQSTSLADVTSQAITNTPYSVLLDIFAPDYRYMRDEIDDVKDWINTALGVPKSEIITAAASGSGVTQTQIDYFLLRENDPNVGILTNRGEKYAESNGSQRDLRQLNLLDLSLISVSESFGPSDSGSRTQEEVTRYAHGLAVWCKITGQAVAVFTHSPEEDDATHEISLEEWGWFIDAVLAVDENMIIPFGELASRVRNSGLWTRNATYPEVWNRNFISTRIAAVGQGSVLKNSGANPFVHGDGDQYDLNGYKVWDELYDIPDGHWIEGADIGPWAVGGADKIYTRLTVVSGTTPGDMVVKLPAASDIIAILGLDSIWYDSAGTPKELAFLSLGDDIKIFDGSRGIIVIYSTDKSEDSTKIHRVIGAS